MKVNLFIIYISLFALTIVFAYTLRYIKFKKSARKFNIIGLIGHSPCFRRYFICDQKYGLEELSAKLNPMNFTIIYNAATSSLLIMSKWYSVVPVYLIFRKVNTATELECGDMSLQQYMPSMLTNVYLGKVMKITSMLEMKMELRTKA